MINLEELQKEVEDILFREHYPNMEKFFPNDKKTFREIIDHIHAATIEECIGVMPDKAGEHVENTNIVAGWNGYRSEAISRLQALITEPGV